MDLGKGPYWVRLGYTSILVDLILRPVLATILPRSPEAYSSSSLRAKALPKMQKAVSVAGTGACISSALDNFAFS